MTGSEYSPALATTLPDGSFVVGVSDTRPRSVDVRLRHVLPDCEVVASFGAVVHSKIGGSFNTLVATPGGQILLGGGVGHTALVGRFGPNGGIDHSFGENGWAKLVPRERPIRGMGGPWFAATSIAVAPSGTIVVGGNDGGAHCCSRAFVGELTSDGAPVNTFGQDGSRIIPRIAGSYTTDVSVNPDSSVNVLTEYEQSGCGEPDIVRFHADGRLDTAFDKAIARTIRTITRPKLRFTPSLAPDGTGGFTLVGGLDRTCVLGGRQQSGGVSVRVGTSGRAVGGLTHFRSPMYVFDGPSTLRLDSGGVVAAAVEYSRAYRTTALLVQAFGADGSRNSAVGDHGQLRFGIPPGERSDYAAAGLLPGAAGSAWLVAELPREIELIPIALT